MTPVTLVIPCKDEALRLDQGAFLHAAEAMAGLAFLFVDDGSTDSTASVLAHLVKASPAVDALYLPKNVGKAEAVRAGVPPTDSRCRRTISSPSCSMPVSSPRPSMTR